MCNPVSAQKKVRTISHHPNLFLCVPHFYTLSFLSINHADATYSTVLITRKKRISTLLCITCEDLLIAFKIALSALTTPQKHKIYATKTINEVSLVLCTSVYISVSTKYPSTTINTHVTKTVKIVCTTKPQSTLTE